MNIDWSKVTPRKVLHWATVGFLVIGYALVLVACVLAIVKAFT